MRTNEPESDICILMSVLVCLLLMAFTIRMVIQ